MTAPTPDEIREAVTYGQTLAVRKILDDMAVERTRMLDLWRHGIGGSRDDLLIGFGAALGVVKRYEVHRGEAFQRAARDLASIEQEETG